MSRGGLRHLSRNFVHLGSFRDGVDVSGRRYPHLISALQLGFSCHLAAAAVTSRRQLRLWKWLYTICAGHSQTAGQFTERLQLPTSPVSFYACFCSDLTQAAVAAEALQHGEDVQQQPAGRASIS